MRINDWDYVGRGPRHQAATQVEIERAGTPPSCIAADLVDLSRQGARLRTEPVLAENEPIVILLRNASIGLDLAFPGAVRWCGQQEEGSRRLYGCQFKEEVPLETLGELFLAGILSVQPTASSG
jgi:hypothetical protein